MSESVVIIPTFNEEANIEAIIRKVFSLHINFDILIVDDNSPDQTSQIIRQLQNEFPNRLYLYQRPGKQGLGTAYIEGFRWALNRKEYQFIFEMDADFSHNPDDLIRLYKTCKEEDTDLAIGSRYVKGVNVVNWPIGRVILSYLASKYVGIVTGIPIKDTTAGFVCFKRQVLKAIDLDKIKFKGYAFQIEMKFAAWKMGFNLKEIPIIFTDRSKGESKMSKGILKEALFGVIEMKFKSFFKNYSNHKLETSGIKKGG